MDTLCAIQNSSYNKEQTVCMALSDQSAYAKIRFFSFCIRLGECGSLFVGVFQGKRSLQTGNGGFTSESTF